MANLRRGYLRTKGALSHRRAGHLAVLKVPPPARVPGADSDRYCVLGPIREGADFFSPMSLGFMPLRMCQSHSPGGSE